MESSAELGLESVRDGRAAAATRSGSRTTRRRQAATLMLVGLLVAELAWLAFLGWVAFTLV
jgi:hypothetical protein